MPIAQSTGSRERPPRGTLSRKTLCLVPCFNEEANLPQLFQDAAAHEIGERCDLLVIDDGSTDASREILRRHPWPVLHNPRNLGYGAAIKIGSRRASEEGYRYIAVMPGDNQRMFPDLIRLIEEIESGAHDVVVGNKFARMDKIPLVRRWGNRFFRAVARVLWRSSYDDVLSGFKAYRLAAILPFIERLPDHYGFDQAFSFYARRYSLRVLEVPVDVRYHRNSSKMRHPLLTGLGILGSALAVRFFDRNGR
jgi:glycosyltransferase involved in cell wall biosynthesis